MCFEIAKMLIAVKKYKFIVPFIIIFGTLSFPMVRESRLAPAALATADVGGYSGMSPPSRKPRPLLPCSPGVAANLHRQR